ncbi:hypothetical protein KP509_04G000600 [Ceratopteris richardii]|uniref:Receptor-like serine/threonine-protein kinase n=1 Tax=Ceratopteris richardii TaxID=49495 RepID=A0A8T2UW06_CERRI|nr:hypothetical protein KP509_04G000600 [Ceratopteris richardii]
MRLPSFCAAVLLAFLLLQLHSYAQTSSSDRRLEWKLNDSFSFSTSSFRDDGSPWQLSNGGTNTFVPILHSKSSNLSYLSAYLVFFVPDPYPLHRGHHYNFTLAIIVGDPWTDYYNVIWNANRHAITARLISLRLREDGNLVLVGEDMQTPIWSSDTAGKGVAKMSLSESPVSLVLSDQFGNIVWQTADYPTDTVGSNQFLLEGKNITSWTSASDPSPGRYTLFFESCGLFLYMMSPENPQRYWALNYNDSSLSWKPSCRTPSRFAPCISHNMSTIEFHAYHGAQTDCSISPTYRSFSLYSGTTPSRRDGTFLQLQYDGNLRVLSYPAVQGRQSTPEGCLLPNSCGPYGLCMGESHCACLNESFFSPLNSSDFSQGCKLNDKLKCNPFSRAQVTMMLKLDGVDYVANDYTPALNLSSEKKCKEDCEHDCPCLLAFWRKDTNACHHMHEVWSLRGGLDQSIFVTYVKVGISPRTEATASLTEAIISRKTVIVASALSALGVVFILVLCHLYRRFSMHKVEEEEDDDDDDVLLNATEGLPSRFKYRDVHAITKGFERQLGKGGFGVVYAGQLLDGTPVAVKKLDSFNQGNKEFKAEVAIMGGISHYNLLRLRGFCAQKGYRFLLYDYMENGSLDQWLFSDDAHRKAQLTWRVRCKIALGIAQGIAYLHNGTRERIIHLDIKPQNILLDSNFEAKVADFGLSRLLKNCETHVMTAMRGTPGYLAPDWLTKGVIDEKCDVFSFGMLLMEIISGRRNLDNSIEPKERMYYPEWAFWQAQADNIAVLTDATLESEEDVRDLRQMIRIAFLCVLEDSTMRPSMPTVVNMLKGLVTAQHLELSSLHQGLLFVLRNPSSFTRTQIGKALQELDRIGMNVEHSSSGAGFISSSTLSGR